MPEQLVIAVRWRHPEWSRISGGAKDLHAEQFSSEIPRPHW